MAPERRADGAARNSGVERQSTAAWCDLDAQRCMLSTIRRMPGV